MASSYSVISLVNENSVGDFMTASEVLIKLASNIINNPTEEKYRKVRLANALIQTKLLNVSGGMECLFEMGFEEDEEFLTFKDLSRMQVLRQIKGELEMERKRLESSQSSSSDKKPAVSPPSQGASHCNSQGATSARSLPASMASEADFLNRLHGAMNKVIAYENPVSQEKARKCIPIEELNAKALENFELKVGEKAGNKTPYDLRDYLLMALLHWFKTSFFKWVDTLPCSFCQGPTCNNGGLPPSREDIQHGAGRVEAHACNVCARVTRFPRYGNAEKLLETRRGRCGEWADCFTLCCRALNFEARYVLDWTDHVWTEVFSVSQDRWLHCDPCENVLDKPLLYESGWGKKLTYIIAFAKDDIQDVTWRYSAKHKELLSRRNLCREKWLCQTVHKLWKQKVSSQPVERKSQLELRLVKELVRFLSVSNETTEALPGRSTGSEEWRRARGEMGNPAVSSTEINKSFIFKPSGEERESEVMHICYSSAKDLYVRKLLTKNETLQSWLKCTNSCVNILRKEEHDWKMVYLARNEGTDSAEITWKFDLNDTDLRISKMELKACSAIYEGATVNWRICAGENCFIQPGEGLQEFMTFDLNGAMTLSITAELKGGKGENAWQHSQLFRQSMDDKDNYPFEVRLSLN